MKKTKKKEVEDCRPKGVLSKWEKAGSPYGRRGILSKWEKVRK